MPVSSIIIGHSVISGVMACLLLTFSMFFEKDKKRSRVFLIWSVLFLASSFTMSEYAFWVEGYNLFQLVLGFNFPLIVYFGIWFVFIIWIFERRGERKIWVILGLLLIATVLIAMNCMNCIRF